MTYPDTPFQFWLEKYRACPDARVWVADQGPQQAWDGCERSDWMLWVYRKCDPDKRTCVQLALAFAERVEHLNNCESKECQRLVHMWLDAAAVAADPAADAAAAAAAAADAAAVAADVAADAAERKAQADIIRQHIPECPLTL